MTLLEQEILDTINEAIGGKYIGQLKVFHEDEVGWVLLLHMNQEQAPMNFVYDGTWEQFKKFIYNELHFRKMHKASFFQAVQELPSLIDKHGELELDYDTVIIT